LFLSIIFISIIFGLLSSIVSFNNIYQLSDAINIT
jgi:hypothetical protein